MRRMITSIQYHILRNDGMFYAGDQNWTNDFNKRYVWYDRPIWMFSDQNQYTMNANIHSIVEEHVKRPKN